MADPLEIANWERARELVKRVLDHRDVDRLMGPLDLASLEADLADVVTGNKPAWMAVEDAFD